MPVITAVPLVMASPSRRWMPSGVMPSRAKTSAVGRAPDAVALDEDLALADERQCNVGQLHQVAAGADAAVARHDGGDAAVEQLGQQGDDLGMNPRAGLCEGLMRASIAARTQTTGSGSPAPAAWLRMMLYWRALRSPSSMRYWAIGPKPVLMP